MSAENIEAVFPRLNRENYTIKSAEDPNYNCIAFACGDTARWWEPIRHVGGYYWPSEATLDTSLESWTQVFKLQGFLPAEDDKLEPGYEEVAIYSVGAEGEIEGRHVARQLVPSGKWISKLGGLEDIEHVELSSLEAPEYGTAVTFLKRPTSPPHVQGGAS